MNILSIIFVALFYLCFIFLSIVGTRAGFAAWKQREWNAKIDPIGYIIYWSKERKKWTILLVVFSVLEAIFGSLAHYFNDK